MPRFKNEQWNFPVNRDGTMANPEHAQLALLMDIRDELQKIGFQIANERGAAKTLRSIRRKMNEAKL